MQISKGLMIAGKWYLITKIAESLVSMALTIFLVAVTAKFFLLTLAQVGAIFGLN